MCCINLGQSMCCPQISPYVKPSGQLVFCILWSKCVYSPHPNSSPKFAMPTTISSLHLWSVCTFLTPGSTSYINLFADIEAHGCHQLLFYPGNGHADVSVHPGYIFLATAQPPRHDTSLYKEKNTIRNPLQLCVEQFR